MPFKISRPSNRTLVRFPKSNVTASSVKSAAAMDPRQTRNSHADSSKSGDPAVESLQNMHAASEIPDASLSEKLPLWLLRPEPAIEEDFPTESLELLNQTTEECLPFLLGSARDFKYNQDGVPPLSRKRHVNFLRRALGQLPAPFVGLDASRPWMLYWAVAALSSLGEDVSRYRHDLVSSLRPIQNATGGFGGGQGQYSHLATTYAAVLSLATVGGDEAYDLIDRKAMWHWLGRLKQPGGEFAICEGGEIDNRAALCAMVLVTLLNLPLDLPQDSPARLRGDETLLTGLADWIGHCQTYEGGLGNSPGSEAHGAYTFCGLACLCILGEPHEMLTKHLDFAALVRWLSARQHAPEGGLAGRTNKLVDGCYSHWLGGCWSLVEAAAGLEDSFARNHIDSDGLFNRQGLIRYILCCGQNEMGGLRDKPSKPPDAYHTQYCLAGLSASQNFYSGNIDQSSKISSSLPAPFSWYGFKERYRPPERTSVSHDIFEESDRVALVHPIYVIPLDAPDRIATYFADKPVI